MSEPHRISLRPPAGWKTEDRSGVWRAFRTFQRSKGLEMASQVHLVVVSQSEINAWSVNRCLLELPSVIPGPEFRYDASISNLLQASNRIEIDWRSAAAIVGPVPFFDVWLEIFS